MLGPPPRRTALVRLAVVALTVATAASPIRLRAQNPTDQPALPASPDNPAPSGSEANPVLPPYAPSNNAASGLLPASPPLPPHPSIPDSSLLPGGTPPPAASPPPLPFQAQTESPPTATAPAAGAPGTTPATGAGAGASTTKVTDAARRFQYAFRISTGVTYDDNVFLTANGSSPGTTSLRSGFSRQDTYFVIDASVSLGYGDFLTRATNYVEFDYTADALIYTRNTDQTTVQHLFNLQGAYHFAQVTLSLSQSVQLLHSTDLGAGTSGSLLAGESGTAAAPSAQVNLDTSRRTGLNIYVTHVDANYALSDKTSTDLDGNLSIDDYETLISSDTFSGDFFFNYSPTGKTTFGLGAGGGYVIQDAPAPDEFYEQINLRLTYQATAKLNLTGSVGVEFREINGVSGVETTPVFNLNANYSPIDSTTLGLTASRSIQTSAVLTGENYDSTGFSFTISQRLFQRATASLSVGYTHSTYNYTGRGGGNTNRADDYYSIEPNLSYSIRDNLSASVFYVHRQDFSSLSNNGFTDNQIGARLSLSF